MKVLKFAKIQVKWAFLTEVSDFNTHKTIIVILEWIITTVFYCELEKKKSLSSALKMFAQTENWCCNHDGDQTRRPIMIILLVFLFDLTDVK